jgi:DNA-binding transcriptional LysR family regulator
MDAVASDQDIATLGGKVRPAVPGRFLTALPRSMLKFHPKNATIKILPIDLPTTRRPIGIITLKNRSLSPVAQRFIVCARELARRPAHRDQLA